MPDDSYGADCEHIQQARNALEHCRFMYKAYAQTCVFPIDPFYEARSGVLGLLNPRDTARIRLMKNLHKSIFDTQNQRLKKLDPLHYHLHKTPNPNASTVFGGDEESYLFFQPRELDISIKNACGFDIEGNAVDGGIESDNNDAENNCGYFQGETGQIIGQEDVGWRSYLGSVIRIGDTIWISFRGSRSGSAARALVGAQFSDKGNPDWVTDMQWLKPASPDFDYGAKVASGFYFAYKSCRTSLIAAYNYANTDYDNLPTKIIFTGHSLGGALAQMAYLDMVLKSHEGTGTALNINYSEVSISCYPISSPPIIKGQKSYHRLSASVAASNVFHFFVPKDAVHAGPLVTSSSASRANAVLAKKHPKTHPQHIGSETVLVKSFADFPDAHEPAEVFKGMWLPVDQAKLADVKKFWPSIINGLEKGYFIGLDDSQKEQYYDALETLVSPNEDGIDPFVLRASQWVDAAKGTKTKLLKLQSIKQRKVIRKEGLSRAEEAELEVWKYERLMQVQDYTTFVKLIRRQKGKWEEGASSGYKHRATSGAYLTLLLGVGAHIILLENGRAPAIPSHFVFEHDVVVDIEAEAGLW